MENKLCENKKHYIYPLIVSLAGVALTIMAFTLEAAGLFECGVPLFIGGIIVALFHFIKSRYNVAYFNSVSVTFFGESYRYSDFDAVEVDERRHPTKVYYSLYKNGECLFTYNDSYDNAERFNGILKNKGIQFMH